MFFGQKYECFDDFAHFQFGRTYVFQKYLLCVGARGHCIEYHGWSEDEGVIGGCEVEVVREDGVFEEVAVAENFEQIVGVVVVEDDSFAILARVLGHLVDGGAPVADEFDDVAGEFPEVVDELEDPFQGIGPLGLVLGLRASQLRLPPGLRLPLPRLQTLSNGQLVQPTRLPPQSHQTRLPRLDCLIHDRVCVPFERTVFDFGEEERVHARVGVGEGELQEIVAVEVREFVEQPLVLESVEVGVEQLLPVGQLSMHLLTQQIELPCDLGELEIGDARGAQLLRRRLASLLQHKGKQLPMVDHITPCSQRPPRRELTIVACSPFQHVLHQRWHHQLKLYSLHPTHAYYNISHKHIYNPYTHIYAIHAYPIIYAIHYICYIWQGVDSIFYLSPYSHMCHPCVFHYIQQGVWFDIQYIERMILEQYRVQSIEYRIIPGPSNEYGPGLNNI